MFEWSILVDESAIEDSFTVTENSGKSFGVGESHFPTVARIYPGSGEAHPDHET